MNNETTEMFNRQIREEFRKLNSIMTNDSEKPAIMKRIAELKAMVDGSPAKVDYCKPAEPTTRELLAEVIKAFRR